MFILLKDGCTQTATYKSVLDSISVKYAHMKDCHIKIQSRVLVSGEEVVSQTYNLYKQQANFCLINSTTEIIYNTSIVLMVIHDQKQLVVRPVTENEIKAIKKFDVPALDSIYNSIGSKQFTETDKYYSFTVFNDKSVLSRSIYSYNKTSFLMEKVEYFYKDTEDNKDQKSVIIYTYGPIPAAKNYFNTEKYLIQTKTGYVASAAYANYMLTISDPYEK